MGDDTELARDLRLAIGRVARRLRRAYVDAGEGLSFLELAVVQLLELRHRAHAPVKDIRTGKDSGFGRFPSRQVAINAAWLEAPAEVGRSMRWRPPWGCAAAGLTRESARSQWN
jgi:hypothetical protein